MFGTFVAQLIPVVMQPVLKRLFTPEQFGVFDLYLKALGILFVFFTFKYEIGVVLPKNRVKSLLLINVSIIISLISTVLLYIIVLLFGNEFLKLVEISEDYRFALYFLPLSTFFYSVFNVINYYQIRQKQFKESSINKISRRAAEAAMQTGAGIVPVMQKSGLIVGDLIGNLVNAFMAFYQAFRSFKLDIRLFKISLLWAIAKEYKDLPKYNIVPELINTLFFAVISFLVLSKFSLHDVGLLELTQRILAIPTAFVSFAVGQVLLQKLTESVNSKIPVYHVVKKIFWMLTLMSIPFVLIILFFANPIFAFVFGPEWTISGEYSKYLVVFYVLAFIVSPLGQILISLKELKINALWKIGRFVAIIPLFFMNFSSVTEYLIYFSAIGSVSYIIYLLIVFHYSRKFDASIKG